MSAALALRQSVSQSHVAPDSMIFWLHSTSLSSIIDLLAGIKSLVFKLCLRASWYCVLMYCDLSVLRPLTLA